MSSANRRLGLFPSVVGFFAGIFAFILYLLKFIASVFTSSGTQTTATQGQSDVNQFTSERRFKQIRQEDDKFDRDNKDDDEERRKTDNGNSTQDKEERRRAREDKESELRQRHSSPTSSPPLMSSRSSGTTRLQFRVHNGPTIVQEFNSSDQLIDARTFVAQQ
jgi:hypothetical protein